MLSFLIILMMFIGRLLLRCAMSMPFVPQEFIKINRFRRLAETRAGSFGSVDLVVKASVLLLGVT